MHQEEQYDTSSQFGNLRDDLMTIDEFELLKVIGEGTYGKVVLARKLSDQRVYAIKSLKKKNLIIQNQVSNAIQERLILEKVRHPFIIELIYAFQSKSKLYLVLEFCPGGELFFHLSRVSHFTEKITKFYSTQIVLALKDLHSKDIIYRDLKPENVLIDKDGYAKITDFGLAKDNIKSHSDTKTLCGTPEYLAPEVIARTGHGKAVDWWSLGCLIYEMLTGFPPFYDHDGNKEMLQEQIIHCKYNLPDNISEECKDLISKLLVAEPSERLGAGESDALEIMSHPWFRGVVWQSILEKQVRPPFKPSLESEIDLKYFDKSYIKNHQLESPKSLNSQKTEEGTWEGFTYIRRMEIIEDDEDCDEVPPAILDEMLQ